MWGYMNGIGGLGASAEELAAQGMEHQRMAESLRNAPGQAAAADMHQRQADSLFAQARTAGTAVSSVSPGRRISATVAAQQGKDFEDQAAALREAGQSAQADAAQRRADALFAEAKLAHQQSRPMFQPASGGAPPPPPPVQSGEVASSAPPPRPESAFAATYVPGRVSANLAAQQALAAQWRREVAPRGILSTAIAPATLGGFKVPKAVLWIAGGVAVLGALAMLVKAVNK